MENLELSAIQTLTGFIVTHASIITPDTSRTLSRSLLWRTGRSATLILYVYAFCARTLLACKVRLVCACYV